MADERKVVVTQDEDEPIPAEIIAKAIIDIDTAMKQISASGLKRRALVALIYDRSKIRKMDIETVLNNLESLRTDWCTK